MRQPRSTTELGRQHEESIAEIYGWDNARRSRSSGASQHDPVDVTTDCFVIECEATKAKSYRITEEFWQEAVSKAHSGKRPAIATRFWKENGRHIDLMTMSAHDHSELMEELEALRALALTPEKRRKR